MSNSPLVSYTKLSPNHSGKRTHSIDRITPHCVVGQLSAETICACFPAGRDASCNYGIGTDGRVSLCVEEKNRSWCSSSNANDQRAVTIECASDKTEPYAMNSKVYNTLIELCVDICKRNGKKKLLWFSIKSKEEILCFAERVLNGRMTNVVQPPLSLYLDYSTKPAPHFLRLSYNSPSPFGCKIPLGLL